MSSFMLVDLGRDTMAQEDKWLKGLTRLCHDEVLSRLAALQKGGAFCDVTLQVDGKQIHAHKAMLALASPYFYVMFSADFKEKQETLITLHDISYEGLVRVIDLIYNPGYSHNRELSSSTVGDVLGAAHLLQIPIIISICERHLAEKMTASTWCQYRALGDKYGLSRVVDRADRLFLDCFVDIIKTPGFNEVSKECLNSYLSNDVLHVNGNEFHVFNAAYEWINAKADRLQYAEEIMHNVRFMLMEFDRLEQLEQLPFMKENKGCLELIQNALQYQENCYERPLVNCPQNRPRGRKELLTVFGGEARNENTFENSHTNTKFYFKEPWSYGDPNPYYKDILPIPFAFAVESLNAVMVNNCVFRRLRSCSLLL